MKTLIFIINLALAITFFVSQGGVEDYIKIDKARDNMFKMLDQQERYYE